MSSESAYSASTERIEGGFVLIPVASLMFAWKICRARPLGIGEFRAWLACHEMIGRRCTAKTDRIPKFTAEELAGLLGISTRRAKNSLKRLVSARLLGWSEGEISFPEPDEIRESGLGRLADTIGGGRGSLTIPRRLLRFMANGARPALVATILGILLRCLSRRRGGFDGRGRVKAGWIASTFGISLRQAKAARQKLVEIGWIEPESSDQWSMNRWGRAYLINLSWQAPSATPTRARSSPPAPEICPRSSPPDSDRDLFCKEIRNQEPPAATAQIGIRLRGTGEGTTHETSKPASMPTPTLADIQPEDLRDTGRTLELHRQAVARGLASPSENGRMKFVALAEHARSIGTTNPGGLFASLVRRGLWNFSTQDDEDSATRRLRDHLYGRPASVARVVPGAPGAVNSGRRSTFVPDVQEHGGPPSTTPLVSLLARFGAG